MYKVIWDSEINGVILTDKSTEINNLILPRPVFFEELDLLEFNKFWEYPRTRNPLLWANGRRYYYKGQWVAEAKGGNIFEAPQIIITENGKDLVLKPINIDLVVKKNQEALRVLENEAMDFVEHTYKSYKRGRNKADCFAVSFSGGKDSQVVLDIVSRIIPPDEYIVVFTDTDMELPSTYENVEETKAYYQKLYTGLQFKTAKGKLSSEESWQKFGPPSRIHRWCCTVHKTAPFSIFIKNLSNGNRQPKILVFEGVRGEESVRRRTYSRIADGVKHLNILNTRPIINWNETEVLLYLIYRNIEINKAYRFGLQRVGCSICPFASEWSETIIKTIYPQLVDRYLKPILKYAEQIGLKDKDKISKYISEGQWKKRAGSRSLQNSVSRMDLIKTKSELNAVLSVPAENFFEWIKTIGDIIIQKNGENICGEIKFGQEVFPFKSEQMDNKKIVVKVSGIDRDLIFLSKFKKILNKTTYCVHCGGCEVECPTGALQVTPSVKIDSNLCAHCGNCSMEDKGCLAAKSIAPSEGGEGMNLKTSSIDKYSTFGMRREWISSFFIQFEKWFVNNNLGPKQIDAMVNWLKDAELIDRKNKTPTNLCIVIQRLYQKNEIMAWTIIWINLYYNSNIVRWYVDNIECQRVYSKNELLEMIKISYSNLSEGTLNNPLSALVNMFDKTPLGKDLNLGIIEKRGNIRYIKKIGADDIHPIAIAYSLYRYAEIKNSRYLSVSEIYKEDCNGGPYKLFGIRRERLENILRYLQEDKNGVLKADLAKGLDNIRLRDDLNHIDVLELLSKDICRLVLI